jgi:hypothetical protein
VNVLEPLDTYVQYSALLLSVVLSVVCVSALTVLHN